MESEQKLMIRVLFCGPDSESGGVANHTINLADNLSRLGVKIIWHKFKGSNTSKIYSRTVGMFIQSLMQRKEYDIIHVQCSAGFGSFPSAVTGTLVSYLLKKKFIFTYHNSKILYPRLFKLCLRRADTIFLVSQLQKDLIQKRSPELVHKVLVIPNGFDRSKFCVKDQRGCRVSLKLPMDKKILLTVGNLLDVKGHRYLIEAMEMIKGKRNDVICAIIGSGDLRQELSDQIAQLALGKYVMLTGGKPHDEIPLLMNACDIFVLPSLNEGNPTVMFETLGCGKPFVGTRVGGVLEVITSDEYGLLVKPADPEDLAEKILAALDKEWDQDAILRYAQQFTWENIAMEIMGVYEQVLK
jgi:glycosyltransferase involved in cell wall biosynthesis